MYRFCLLFIWVVTLASCDQIPTTNEYTPEEDHFHRPVVSHDPLDTVKNNIYDVQAQPAIFEKAYFPGTVVKEDSVEIKFYAATIGKLKVVSGKIIACDPVLMMDTMRSLAATFPTGEFPVQLAIAMIHTDQRVAFSRILFSDKPVAKWEVALLPGQQSLAVGDTTYYGYGVDAGTGAFIDSVAYLSFDSLSNKDHDLTTRVFTEMMDIHYRDTWDYIVPLFKGYNLAAFSTGYGDGTYGSYIGYDADGKICRLLTDLQVVSWKMPSSKGTAPDKNSR